MAQEIKLPSLGKKPKSVEILSVKVSPGDTIRKGQPLLEVESDKGTQDVPSPLAGRVTEVRVKANDQIGSGQVICLLEAEGASPARTPEPPKQPAAPAAPPSPPPAARPMPHPRAATPPPAPP